MSKIIKKGIIRDTVEDQPRNLASSPANDQHLPTVERKQLNLKGKAAIFIGVAALAFAFKGHAPTERSDVAMKKEAKAKYDAAKQQASPSELFALRYTDTAGVEVNKYEGGSGILGFVMGLPKTTTKFNFEDTCMKNTSYDINGGDINFNVDYRGVFSSVKVRTKADIPAAGAQASYDPSSEVLTVLSGNSKPIPLHFAIEDTDLRPLDQTTNNQLATNGCNEEIQIHE